ncbi:MAG TPA: hypothetical protein VGH42_14475 [Verrucomicrobiae bacterium]
MPKSFCVGRLDLPASGNQLFLRLSDMINYFKFKFALAKLHREKGRMIKAYHIALHEAHANHQNREQIEEITSSYRFETDMIEDEINLMISDYWISKVQRLGIFTPWSEDRTIWNETNSIPDRRVLPQKGVSEIRSQIRAERKAQMEMWLPWITVLTGLVGALIGLLTVLKK